MVTLRTSRFNTEKILRGAHFGFMCFVRISEQTATVPYTLLTDWFCKTEVESVYCAVRAESFYKTDMFRL